MNKIIFSCKYFKIKVREVLIILLVLILLFFGLNSCQRRSELEKKKEEKIENNCDFTNENINDFNKLMSRVDLCSEGWFKDLNAYITRIEDQNKYLKKKDKKEFQTVLKYQKELLKDLNIFKKDQKDKNIEGLEKSFKEYKDFYDGKCGKGKIGN
ncbi:MAG: hypothetical protein RR945_09315 [Erysipelotrichaceae bacterium]